MKKTLGLALVFAISLSGTVGSAAELTAMQPPFDIASPAQVTATINGSEELGITKIQLYRFKAKQKNGSLSARQIGQIKAAGQVLPGMNEIVCTVFATKTATKSEVTKLKNRAEQACSIATAEFPTVLSYSNVSKVSKRKIHGRVVLEFRVSQPISEFELIVDNSKSGFLSGTDMLRCMLALANVEDIGWFGGRSKPCFEDIGKMVATAKSLVLQFDQLVPPYTAASNVKSLASQVKVIAQSGFDTHCTESAMLSGSARCWSSRRKIAGDGRFALGYLWEELRKW